MITFRLRDEETDLAWEFLLTCTVDEYIEMHEDDAAFRAHMDRMESEYGVHDFNGAGDVVGYCSYEVPLEKYPQLLDEWRGFFRSVGCLV